MAKANPIAPFPADIDREAFGHWLSGFVDGEGCFFISNPRCTKTGWWRPRAQFIVTLRADDLRVLLSIQSFFQCGRVHVAYKKTTRNPNSVAIYYASTTADLANRIIPHFDAYPLRSKKQRDFVTFKKAIVLMAEVSGRDRRGTRIGKPGQPWRWMQEDIDAFVALVQEIRNGRQYVHPPVTLPPSS